MKEENRYGDIMGLAHPVSARHRPMPPAARAAQFAPFAALTGFEEAVQETAKRVEDEVVRGKHSLSPRGEDPADGEFG